ncbi:hypothetical protein [uncultured Gammaproteobacteria bacterium]|nr:hypothetical protein [uncultured Gammaproteobacteria bacterium]
MKIVFILFIYHHIGGLENIVFSFRFLPPLRWLIKYIFVFIFLFLPPHRWLRKLILILF